MGTHLEFSQTEYDFDDEAAEDAYYDNLKEEDFSKYEQTHPKAGEISASLARHVNLSHKSTTDVRLSEEKKNGSKDRGNQGRDDRATTEQVMDPRTRMILFKMLNRHVFEEIHGCISTGKEANVYHATSSSDTIKELAVKVFKTSIMVFRDRDKYVNGDHRFRSGYGRGNPRKMVRIWAEKELKNLNRLSAAGIPSPTPVCLRGNVLVMEFLGEEGWPAPRLKDANVDVDRMRALYLQTVRLMRIMLHQAKLVHGDLSEYNMLYFQKKVYIIDVSQSVEMDHPRALDFLRIDCVNVTRFFKQKLTNTLTPRQLFEFVRSTAIGVEEEEMDNLLLQLSEEAVQPESDQVFLTSFIPTTLNQVGFEELNYGKPNEALEEVRREVMTMVAPPVMEVEEEDVVSEDEEEETSGNRRRGVNIQYRKSQSSKEEKKAHKLQVKQENSEKRKHKIKKKDKKLHRVVKV